MTVNNPQVLLPYCLAMLLLCWAKPSLANSVGISYGQQDYQVSLPTNSNVSLKPVGSAVSLTLDLGTDWLVDFDYQQWADEQSVNNQFDLTLDIKTFGSGLTYFLNDWSFSTSYSRSEIDTDYSGKRRVANSLTENITASSIGGSVAYGQAIDNWFYSALFSGLYSSWDFDKLEVINNLSGSGSNSDSGSGSDNVSILIREEKSAGNSTSLSASISLAHFWPITAHRGILLGGLFSWHYLLAGDAVLISRNGRNFSSVSRNIYDQRAQSNAALNTISGDDSYGQVSFYVSYDLTSSLSIEFDSSVNVASDYNVRTWSIGLGYLF